MPYLILGEDVWGCQTCGGVPYGCHPTHRVAPRPHGLTYVVAISEARALKEVFDTCRTAAMVPARIVERSIAASHTVRSRRTLRPGRCELLLGAVVLEKERGYRAGGALVHQVAPTELIILDQVVCPH